MMNSISLVRHRLLWYGGIPLLLTALCYPLRIHGYLNPYDEGQWLGAAQAMLQHHLAYRDFVFHYGPFLPLAMRLYLKMGEPTVSGLRTLFWALNLMGLLAIYVTLLRFVKSTYLRVAFASFIWMLPWGCPVLTIPYAVRYGVGFLALWAWGSSGLVSGIFTSIAFFTSQEVGAAALIASSLFFAVGPGWKRDLPRLFLAFGSVMILGGGMFVWAGLLKAYWVSAFSLTSEIIWTDRLALPSLTQPEGLAMCSAGLTYVGVLCWMIGEKYRHKATDRVLLALCLYGILTALPEWGRLDRWHIYFALSPVFLIWACLIERGSAQANRITSMMTGAILFMALCVAIPPYWHEHIRDVRRRKIQRSTRLVRLGRTQIPGVQANGYEFLVDWIQRHTAPDEPFLFFPYDGCIYFLADRPNPTRFPVLALAMTPALRAELLQQIKSPMMQTVIWDTENTNFHGLSIDQFMPEITNYIRTHFQAVEKHGPFIFWKRK
jgi:hypothetical protein